ncbi:Abortive infection bacteriophage resistance protein [Lachnospiraceae bacterium]|nr:Abortive infection bacteriophage resistance protein [Lachnospiraceae bacterium]
MDKEFKTYNQQMRKLRDVKHMECDGSVDKSILARNGYFNLINGYKTPFVTGRDLEGNHIYFRDTSLTQFYELKKFDDNLRMLLLKYITTVEENVRTLTGYKFDECNKNGAIPWFDTTAYDPGSRLQYRMNTISSAYNELSKSRLEYVKFYMDNHENIPTWIMIKVVNFSTFIDVLQHSKIEVRHAICELFDIKDQNGYYDVKLLIGSLHWMRKIRNACAHNERIYCLSQSQSNSQNSGRINDKYILQLRPSYSRDTSKHIFDIAVYFKYYLPQNEFKQFIREFKDLLIILEKNIVPQAFQNVRGQLGVKNIADLDLLEQLPKLRIEYNKFDRM